MVRPDMEYFIIPTTSQYPTPPPYSKLLQQQIRSAKTLLEEKWSIGRPGLLEHQCQLNVRDQFFFDLPYLEL